jgi:hypothetical protein
MTKIKVLLAAALPVTIAAVVLGAQGAQASTRGCTNGPLFAYCGTQSDHGSPVLVIDSARQSAALNNPVIGWYDSASDPATDWFQLPYGGIPSLVAPGAGYMFFFAPRGVISQMCMSDPGDGHIVLRGCNGSNWQRWILTEIRGTGYYTWTNRATHRILQAGPLGAQLVTVTPPATTTGTQQWHFSL